MTMRSAFGRSEFHAFLYAPVGDEKAGDHLTVMSALARLGLDPWQEAARLSELPREAAARALVSAFATLPEGDWKAAQAITIAARLVDSLPSPNATSVGAPPGDKRLRRKWGPMTWLFRAALAVGWFMVVSYLTASPHPDSAPTVSISR